jgi:hypothetical protein
MRLKNASGLTVKLEKRISPKLLRTTGLPRHGFGVFTQPGSKAAEAAFLRSRARQGGLKIRMRSSPSKPKQPRTCAITAISIAEWTASRHGRFSVAMFPAVRNDHNL